MLYWIKVTKIFLWGIEERSKLKELNENELESSAGGVGSKDSESSNKEKWARVGIKIVEVRGIWVYL